MLVSPFLEYSLDICIGIIEIHQWLIHLGLDWIYYHQARFRPFLNRHLIAKLLLWLLPHIHFVSLYLVHELRLTVQITDHIILRAEPTAEGITHSVPLYSFRLHHRLVKYRFLWLNARIQFLFVKVEYSRFFVLLMVLDDRVVPKLHVFGGV